ncbi:MAG TPA: endolytic transglycosylase MltG [Vicinamibacterales bacterium]|nr:endolytic transglycosylase MltG [Vicinamibacterales bacterium]
MKRVLLLLFVLVLAATAARAWWLWEQVHAPFKGFSAAEQFVEIPSGAGNRAIAGRLVEAGVVRDALTFRAAAQLSGEGRKLKAGEYRFDRALTPLEVIDKIARGDVYVVSITFPEGLNIVEMSKVFEAHGFGTAASFVEAAKDPKPIHDLDPAATDLEGYLFPDTYAVPRKTDAPKLVHLMVAQFQKALTADLRAQIAAGHVQVRTVVTLASIVEKETAKAEERPLVAAVYENRLRVGMLLQCDPTVIYALERAGRYHGNIHKDDLQIDSPYNTYRFAGLPPGPIASPGRASLAAAVAPADADFLYFVSRNDGSHEFATTLTEHNRNVQKYQVQYFRDRRRSQK